MRTKVILTATSTLMLTAGIVVGTNALTTPPDAPEPTATVETVATVTEPVTTPGVIIPENVPEAVAEGPDGTDLTVPTPSDPVGGTAGGGEVCDHYADGSVSCVSEEPSSIEGDPACAEYQDAITGECWYWHELDNSGDEKDPEPEVIEEDDPRWDCRTMGNRICGVDIHGDHYLIEFDAEGLPVYVVPMPGPAGSDN